jgi:pyruvate ferredoxin oxidoreductase gamma subunit/2-oxoisovalerate ferredoxin oxidoreductase gamma subunit
MLEIRIHGRGGQGAVLASQILSYAFFLEGKYSQSFPTFGAERRGAPVSAFVRTSEEFINLRSQVTSPDHVIVLSGRLAETVDVTAGLKPGGLLLINTEKQPEAYAALQDEVHLVTMNIGAIALKHKLGNRIMPMVNAPILGAFARLTELLSLESLDRALPHFIPANLEGNRQAMQEAFEAASGLVATA